MSLSGLTRQSIIKYNISMIIKSIAETSYSGMFRVEPMAGSAFFIRKEYLSAVDFESVVPGAEFDGEAQDELLDAGLISAVELKAVGYLARAEQSRFGLTNKLINKKYDKKYIDAALTYLESRGYLSDARFAECWLHDRKINHFEGRSKLASELAARGIGREVTTVALDTFFEENDESEICKRAVEKFKHQGKDGEKLIAALMKAGFTYKIIKAIIQE